MSDTMPRMVEVVNPAEEPFRHFWNGVEYVVPAGGSLEAPEEVGRHLQFYGPHLEVKELKFVPEKKQPPARKHACPFPECSFRTSDFSAFVAHVETHARPGGDTAGA